MNSVRLYQYYLPIWRRFKVRHMRDSFVEILRNKCPFGRTRLQTPRAKSLNCSELRILRKQLNQRTCHVPLQYVVGRWSFRYIRLRTVPPVFIPRFETQQLLTILSPDIKKPVRFLDLCCGSGAIGISLVKEYDASGVAVDINPKCIEASRHNLLLNKLPQESIRFVQTDCIDYLRTTDDRFNLIITNPPYISEKQRATLPKEVLRYESHLALFGGEDGLHYVRQIIDNYKRVLLPGGILAVEYGGQMLSADLEQHVVRDFYGQRRFIIIRG